MEVTAALYLRQTVFLRFEYHFRGKYTGIRRGMAPWLRVSDRGEKQPRWHAILLANLPLLCYTFFRASARLGRIKEKGENDYG